MSLLQTALWRRRCSESTQMTSSLPMSSPAPMSAKTSSTVWASVRVTAPVTSPICGWASTKEHLTPTLVGQGDQSYPGAQETMTGMTATSSSASGMTNLRVRYGKQMNQSPPTGRLPQLTVPSPRPVLAASWWLPTPL
jgi:hypothetical protein